MENRIGEEETFNADNEELNDTESRLISVHSSDSSYAPSDAPIFLNEYIQENNNPDNMERKVKTPTF